MTPLDVAINTAFAASAPVVAAFPGGLWPEVADPGAAMPYMVYTILSGKNQTVYGNKKYAKVYIKFQGIGAGKAVVGGLMNTFTGVFDDTVLTLSTGANFDCVRQQDPLPSLWAQRTGSATDIWSWSVEYLYQTRT